MAFTAGSQIYFAPGHYRPVDPAGQRLLARQLTYVLQQRAGMARNALGRGMVLVRDPELDAQADQIAEFASRPGVMQAKALPAARGLFQIRTSIATPGRQHLALYERGRAVGGADVVLEGSRTKLYNLHVDAEHRSRGGGEELVRAAAVASERIGKRTLALEADDDGSGKLLRWYQSQGFRSIGKDSAGRPAFEAPGRAAPYEPVQPDSLVARAAGGEQRFAGTFVQDAVQVTPALEVAAALRLDGWQNLAASQTLTHGDGSAMTTPVRRPVALSGVGRMVEMAIRNYEDARLRFERREFLAVDPSIKKQAPSRRTCRYFPVSAPAGPPNRAA